MTKRVAVIGGGASGLVASISAAYEGAKITVYESGERVGRKILATGNGKCNMTNINADISHYHGTNPKFILGAKNRFWVNETLDFFSHLGILTKTDDEGRVYPYSEQASAVLDMLRFNAGLLGVNLMCSYEVSSVSKSGDAFTILSSDGRAAYADSVIVASGGKAAPHLGATGAGYEILKSFGHTITKLSPSLVQIKTDKNIVKPLKGIRLNATASIGSHSERGEILFTDYGLSGIAVFSLSARLDKKSVISLDIMPEYTFDDVYDILCTRAGENPDITLENFFIGIFHKRVGQTLFKIAGIAPLSRKAATLGEKEIRRLCSIIKKWEFKPEGTMSWSNAQVTKGGALTDEFDSATMESKLVRGLYAAGEVLDIDGDCGGYNLQWAWSSGYLAGKNAAKLLTLQSKFLKDKKE